MLHSDIQDTNVSRRDFLRNAVSSADRKDPIYVEA